MRVLRLEVSVYNGYITNLFQTTFARGGGGDQSRPRIPPLDSRDSNGHGRSFRNFVLGHDEPSSYIMSRMYCWEKKKFQEMKSSRQDIKRETRTESSAEFLYIKVFRSYKPAMYKVKSRGSQRDVVYLG